MEKETLCWSCQNFSKCSWSRGVPVENWDATPTIIKDNSNNVIKEIHSYCVHSCPQFEADLLQRVSTQEIAGVINKSRNTVFRCLKTRRETKRLREMLAAKGYKLYIYKEVCDDYGNAVTEYYLEKLRGVNESS